MTRGLPERDRAPALLLLHRLHCDPCYNALMAGDPAASPCAVGFALRAASRSVLGQPAGPPAPAADASASQAQPDSGNCPDGVDGCSIKHAAADLDAAARAGLLSRRRP